MRFFFADCELDSEAGELRRGGQVVSLSPRGLQLLTLLLERRPNPVSQRDLRDALWPQTHVGYTSLAQVVAEVRKAIGDEPGVEPMIRTVPRIGYAFVAPAPGEARPPAAAPDPVAPERAPGNETGRMEGARRVRVLGKAAALGGLLLLAGVAGAYLSASRTRARPDSHS